MIKQIHKVKVLQTALVFHGFVISGFYLFVDYELSTKFSGYFSVILGFGTFQRQYSTDIKKPKLPSVLSFFDVLVFSGYSKDITPGPRIVSIYSKYK